MIKKDISNRQDIDKMIRLFYDKLLDDSLMRPIFIDAVDLDFEAHFDILVDFWDNILFYSGAYKRNAMLPHLKLHEIYPFNKKHFIKWLALFNLSVDELFLGEKANLAKERAQSIATIMQMKMKIG